MVKYILTAGANNTWPARNATPNPSPKENNNRIFSMRKKLEKWVKSVLITFQKTINNGINININPRIPCEKNMSKKSISINFGSPS